MQLPEPVPQHIEGESAYISSAPVKGMTYLNWLYNRFLYLELPEVSWAPHSICVKLNDIYVSLRIQQEEKTDTRKQTLLEKEYQDLRGKSSFAQRLAHLEKLANPTNVHGENPFKLPEIFGHQRHLVILGGPGSGKSTLLRYFALRCIQSQKENRYTESYFPILLPISAYAEHALAKKLSLGDFLSHYCYMLGFSEPGLETLFHEQLTCGNCLILLDGLDETINTDERRQVIEHIEEFVHSYEAYSHCFVVASRSIDYWSAPLSSYFVRYQLQEMDEPLIEKFLDSWYLAVETAVAPHETLDVRKIKASREKDEILSSMRISPAIRSLAANPLFLSLLALIQRTGSQMPQKRVELYKLAAEIFTQAWHYSSAKDAPSSTLLKREYLSPLLSKLAYWLHSQKSTGVANEDEVIEVLSQEWKRLEDVDWEEVTTDPDAEIKNFLEIIRKRSGIFVEKASKQYGFIHRTFEEYYAARYMAARGKTQIGLIRRHLHDPRWHEPNLLALSYIGQRSPEDAIDVLETVVLEEEWSEKPLPASVDVWYGERERSYLFALQYIHDYIPMSVNLAQWLIEWLANEILYNGSLEKKSEYQQMFMRSLERLKGSKVAETLSLILIKARDDGSFQVSQRAVEGLTHLGMISW